MVVSDSLNLQEMERHAILCPVNLTTLNLREKKLNLVHILPIKRKCIGPETMGICFIAEYI